MTGVKWVDEYTPEAEKDIKSLREPHATRAKKAIAKVLRNPLPKSEGGYGEPLGNKHGDNLTGLLTIKLKGGGVRMVYRLERVESVMRIIIVSV